MKTNYHTHTTWCDGRDTPAAMVEAAIEKGFDVLGFSAHVGFPERADWMLPPERAEDYARDIRSLAAEHRDRIGILCGVEADYIQGITEPTRERYRMIAPDYMIGSVHTVIAPDGGRVPVDASIAELEEGIARHFGGDARRFVSAYFGQEREMIEGCEVEIVGHLDLVRKFNSKRPYFDETADWYVEELRKTADAMAGRMTEVNTGGILRGWMTEPYPSREFRRLLVERGVRFVLSSDAHATEQLDGCFDRFESETFVTGI